MPNNRTAATVTALFLLVFPGTSLGCDDSPAETTPAPAEEHAEHAEPADDDHAHHEAAGEVTPLLTLDDGARVFFVAPAAGAEVTGALVDGKVAVAVEMGAENVRIGPAGAVEDGVGHHHIIIDSEATATGESVPADEQHIHFGGGQTETTVNLTPGEHVLRLQLADGLHRSYGPALSTSITVTVVAATAPSPDGE